MQLIYGGKTNQSLPKIKFPQSFSLSVNENHFSNTTESIKLIDEIIVPYIEKERHRLDRENQAALSIIDVFRGQMTQPVIDMLKENNIFLVRVPPNTTHIYQRLDLTFNRSAKSFCKRKFTEWYSYEITRLLDAGTKLDDIEVKLKLTILKPLHASWIIDFFNHMTSTEGKQVIINGWKSAGILEAISVKDNMPSVDPFNDIDPLLEALSLSNLDQRTIQEEELASKGFLTVHVDDCVDENGEWIMEGDDNDRNIFDVIIDDRDGL